MEERLGEMRKGSHCFFKSSGYDKLELKTKFNDLMYFTLTCQHIDPLPTHWLTILYYISI